MTPIMLASARFSGRVRGARTRTAAVAALLFLATAVVAPRAAAEELVFDIPPQKLSSALRSFADQANVQLYYPQDLVREISVQGLSGKYDPEPALSILLAPTGLEFEFVNDNTIVIQRRKAAGGTSTPSSSNQPANVNFAQVAPAEETGKAAAATDTGDAAEQTVESADARTVMEIEEIVVTAQKRVESLQKVPFKVTTFGAEAIHSAGIFTLEDVASRTPGFTIGNFGPSAPNLTLRGIGSTDRDAGSDRSVVVFVDEVYIGRAGGSAFDLFDLERIEVLHGPQGTLFGKNVVGGAVHFISQKPQAETSARLEAGLGNYNLRETRGMFNVPLSDSVFGRVSFSTRDRDGFQTNFKSGRDVDTADNVSLRAQLKFVANEDLEFLLSADVSRDRVFGVSRKVAPTAPFVAFLGFTPDPNPRIVEDNVDGFFDRDIYGVSGRVDWTTKLGTLTSITAFRSVWFNVNQDVVGIPVDASFDALGRPRGFLSIDMTEEDYDLFSQELRLASLPESERWTWVAGLYFSNEDTDRVSVRDRSLLGRTSKPKFDQANRTRSFAVFGQITLAVTERLNVTAGGRYTYDKKDFSLAVTDASGGTADSLNPATEEFAISTDDSWDAFTPKFTVDFSPTEDTMLYVTVSRGFKSGGFQGFAPDAASAMISFDPEFAWNYEIGTKTQWFDNRLQANLTAFYIDFTDLQFRQRILTVPGDQASAVVVILNATDAAIKGVEAELVAVPVQGLTLRGSYAYLDTKIKNFLADVEGVEPGFTDLSGNRLALAPKHAFTVSAEYVFPVGDVGIVSLRGEYRYRGRHFFDVANSPAGNEDGYGLLDGRIAFESNDGGWELALWAKNLTDELYRNQVQPGVGGTVGISRFGDPRTYGVTLSWRYN